MLGDYSGDRELTEILVAETGNFFYNRLLVIHEIIEDTLREVRGISNQTIDDYCDKIFKTGKVPDSIDPESPIHDIHMVADKCERIVCGACGIKWSDYDKATDQL